MKKLITVLLVMTLTLSLTACRRKISADATGGSKANLSGTMEENVDKLLLDHDLPLLQDRGRRSHKQMEAQVEEIYMDFDRRRKAYEAQEEDRRDAEELKMLENLEGSIRGRETQGET